MEGRLLVEGVLDRENRPAFTGGRQQRSSACWFAGATALGAGRRQGRQSYGTINQAAVKSRSGWVGWPGKAGRGA